LLHDIGGKEGLKNLFPSALEDIRQAQHSLILEPAANFAGTQESKEARNKAQLMLPQQDEISTEEAIKLKTQCTNCIGQGSYGKVFKVEFYGIIWAVKWLMVTSNRQEIVQHEVNVHRSLRSKRCVIFRAAYTKPPDVFIITEYCPGGNLSDRIYSKSSPMTEQQKFKYAIEIAEGLTELHHQNTPIVHRDLKPTNVLIDEHGDVKLCDFGFAHTIQGSTVSETADVRAHSTAGTDLYKAPEVWDPDQVSGTPSDIYSFGIMLHEIFARSIPWGDKTKEALTVLHLQHRQIPISDNLRVQYPKIAGIVEQCTQISAKKRPTSLQALNWLKAFSVTEKSQ